MSIENPENLLSYFGEDTPLSADVVYDYYSKNQQKYPIAKGFSLGPDSYELFGDDDYCGVLEFSRVVFNAARTQALFQTGLKSGGSRERVLCAVDQGKWRMAGPRYGLCMDIITSSLPIAVYPKSKES